MTLRSVHALSYLSPRIAQARKVRLAGTDRIGSVCTITAGVRWRVTLVAAIQTRTDELLSLAGSDELNRPRCIGNFEKAGDNRLLTRAL
jgi:hypothetical protein